MMSARGELSRTGKENRTLPTGVSVVMVQRAMPPGSRRIVSTPPNISVKCVRFEKKFFTACSGASTLSLPLNDERTRNIESEVGDRKSGIREIFEPVRFGVFIHTVASAR